MPPPPHSDVQEDEYDWPDDESVRPDIAQFYFYEPPSSSGITTSRVALGPSPNEPDDLSTYKFPFFRSFSSENIPPSPMMPAVPSDIHNYYIEHGRDVGEEGEGRSQFFFDDDDDDDENNHVMRTRFVARVADAFHGAEKTRPVPKLLSCWASLSSTSYVVRRRHGTLSIRKTVCFESAGSSTTFESIMGCEPIRSSPNK